MSTEISLLSPPPAAYGPIAKKVPAGLPLPSCCERLLLYGDALFGDATLLLPELAAALPASLPGAGLMLLLSCIRC